MRKRKKNRAQRAPAVMEEARNPRLKLTQHEIELIRHYYAIGLSPKLLAAKFEVSAQQIRNIARLRSRLLF